MKKLYLFLLALFAFTAAGVAQNVWGVKLQAAGPNKTDVIKLVSKELSISLGSAKTLVDSAPVILTTSKTKTNAENFDQALKKVGATSETILEITKNTFPDTNFRSFASIQCDDNGDGHLSQTELDAVELIDATKDSGAAGLGIKTFDGIQYFTKLRQLRVNFNRIETGTLDLSKNTELTNLVCWGCGLTSLDLSKNTKLRYLLCQGNMLTSLDLSANTALLKLTCYGNSIKGDAMTALINSLPEYTTPKEFTVVDRYYTNNVKHDNVITTTQVAAAKAKGWIAYDNNDGGDLIEYAGSEPEPVEINETNFPDANFRSHVANFYDLNSDGKLNQAELTAVTDMTLNNKKIANLKGIEHFTALGVLRCYYNELTELDLSKNTELTSLLCHSNDLTSLDLKANTKLKTLSCYSNQLTRIDITGCTSLENLYCETNKISGDAMTALVTALCDRTETSRGMICVIQYPDSNEENVCTTEQVAIAKGKNWKVQAFNTTKGSYEDYAGSVPTAIRTVENATRTAADNAWYSIDGKKLSGEPTQRGIYIHGGRKVIK